MGSVLMTGISLGLFFYWLRYTCKLILSVKCTRDYTIDVAAANDLRFLQVQEALLSTQERLQLNALQTKLKNDYRLLTYLLVHGPAFHVASDRLEQFMMMLDFRILSTYYRLVSRISVGNGKRALQEMTQVIAYFANRIGERSAYAAALR